MSILNSINHVDNATCPFYGNFQSDDSSIDKIICANNWNNIVSVDFPALAKSSLQLSIGHFANGSTLYSSVGCYIIAVVNLDIISRVNNVVLFTTTHEGSTILVVSAHDACHQTVVDVSSIITCPTYKTGAGISIGT